MTTTRAKISGPPRCPASPRAARRTDAAFTLLEILIATAAFAIVLAAINSVYYSALRLRNKTTEVLDDELAVQQTLSYLRRDLANLLPPGGTLVGQLQTTPSLGSSLNSSTTGSSSSSSAPSSSFGSSRAGSSSSMSLLAAASQPGQSSPEFFTSGGTIDESSPWAEVQKVSYYLTPSTNTATAGSSRDLVRSVTRNLLPSLQETPVATPLLTGVETIYFQYHDGLQWKDTWDSTTETTTRLPLAVRVQINRTQPERGRLAPPPIEIVVPVLAYGGTNSTATSTTTGQ